MINCINSINEKSLEQKMDLTDTTFDIFEQNSVINVKHILDIKCEGYHARENQSLDADALLQKYNDLMKEHQLLHYRFVWVGNKVDLKARFKKMIKRNGFHEKEGEDLERYINNAFETLFTDSKNTINNHMDSYACLEDTTADDRFNTSEAKLLFRGLIMSCIEIEKTNITEINNLQRSRKLGRKILGIITKFLRRD